MKLTARTKRGTGTGKILILLLAFTLVSLNSYAQIDFESYEGERLQGEENQFIEIGLTDGGNGECNITQQFYNDKNLNKPHETMPFIDDRYKFEIPTNYEAGYYELYVNCVADEIGNNAKVDFLLSFDLINSDTNRLLENIPGVSVLDKIGKLVNNTFGKFQDKLELIVGWITSFSSILINLIVLMFWIILTLPVWIIIIEGAVAGVSFRGDGVDDLVRFVDNSIRLWSAFIHTILYLINNLIDLTIGLARRISPL